MTTKDEVRSTVEALRTERALKLALEALEDYVEEYGPHEQQSTECVEPVAWYDEEYDCAYTATELDGGDIDGLVPLYTSPQENANAGKPWRGLTDDERLEAAEIDGADEWFWKVCEAIEAKLKEKNGF